MTRKYHPNIEITIPGATTEDVRMWAGNVSTTSPLTTGRRDGASVDIVVTDEPFMGVELSIVHGEARLLSLVAFASVATDEERALAEATDEELEQQEVAR